MASLILACSLPAMAGVQHQTEYNFSSLKSWQGDLGSLSTEKVSEVVHKQLKWDPAPEAQIVAQDRGRALPSSVPLPRKSMVAVSSVGQSKIVVASIKSTPKSIQVAVTRKQQVSRSNSSDLTEHALSLLGVPYVFGGTSRDGFDCSGYTQYVFKGSGTYLPRTASEQFKVGSSVTQNQLQAGDLVFFSTYTSGASHVGIYIGGGRFVHASNSGVRVTSLSDSYYAKRYLGARRVH